ncbi:nucleotide-binding protein [Nocardia africana]
MSRNNNDLPMLPPWLSESDVTQTGYEAPVENLPHEEYIPEDSGPRRLFSRKSDDRAESDKKESDKKWRKSRRKDKSDAEPAAGETSPSWGPPGTTGPHGDAQPGPESLRGNGTPSAEPMPWQQTPDGYRPDGAQGVIPADFRAQQQNQFAQPQPPMQPPQPPTQPPGPWNSSPPAPMREMPHPPAQPPTADSSSTSAAPSRHDFGRPPGTAQPNPAPVPPEAITPPPNQPPGPLPSEPLSGEFPSAPPQTSGRPPIPPAPHKLPSTPLPAADGAEMTVRVTRRPDLPPPPQHSAPTPPPLPEWPDPAPPTRSGPPPRLGVPEGYEDTSSRPNNAGAQPFPPAPNDTAAAPTVGASDLPRQSADARPASTETPAGITSPAPADLPADDRLGSNPDASAPAENTGTGTSGVTEEAPAWLGRAMEQSPTPADSAPGRDDAAEASVAHGPTPDSGAPGETALSNTPGTELPVAADDTGTGGAGTWDAFAAGNAAVPHGGAAGGDSASGTRPLPPPTVGTHAPESDSGASSVVGGVGFYGSGNASTGADSAGQQWSGRHRLSSEPVAAQQHSAPHGPDTGATAWNGMDAAPPQFDAQPQAPDGTGPQYGAVPSPYQQPPVPDFGTHTAHSGPTPQAPTESTMVAGPQSVSQPRIPQPAPDAQWHSPPQPPPQLPGPATGPEQQWAARQADQYSQPQQYAQPNPYAPGPQANSPQQYQQAPHPQQAQYPQGQPPLQYPPNGVTPSLEDVPMRRAKKAPGSGWRRAVHHMSGGAINPGMSAEERRLQELVARIRQPVRGDYRIATLSLKGGVGKTTTTMGIGSIFASIRGDRVIAVDANPDFGTLSQRVPLQTRSTVRDLLLDQQIRSYGDVRRHTSQATSRLEVLASERDPAASESFSEDEYRQVLRVLQRFYNIILTDCGTGLMHSAMAGVLDLAHSLVLISSSAIDGARSAAATLDWLSLHGHDHLVRNAVVVINLPREGSPNVAIQHLREYFLARCRAVHVIPYDPHLAEGAEIDLARLHKNTKRALVELAATVADDFATDHRRFGGY